MSSDSTRDFTPGPWKIERMGDYNAHRQWKINGGPHAQRVVGSYEHAIRMPQEGAANARLIAAAPDLYEALTKCLPFIDDALDAHSVMSDSAITDECRAAVDGAKTALLKAREAQ